MTPASDLVEGLLNNVSRPPVLSRDGTLELYAGKALPHFNEVDEGAAVDALVTNPRPVGCKKLRGADDLWRIRVGDFRIVYRVDDRERAIEIAAVRNRKDVYE